MAASENPIAGINLLTKIQSTIVGAQTDATLSVPQELRELITKNEFGWVSNLSSKQEWSVSHSGLVLNSSSEAFISNQNAKLELEVDTTDDSTDNPTLVEIPRLDSIDVTLAAEMAETGALDKALWRFIRPAERSVQIDIEGSYLDPASDVGAVYEEIMAAKDAGNNLPFTFTLAGRTFSGDVAFGDMEIAAPGGAEDATISLSMASDDQVTKGGTAFDSSVSMIIDAFFNETEVDCAIEHHDGGSVVTGSTKYTGSGFFGEIALSVADGEEATIDATVEGNGALTRPTA